MIINNFYLWIAPSNSDYKEILLTKNSFYVDIKEFVDFRFPPKPLKKKKKKYEEDEEEYLSDTPEEEIYRNEYCYYEMRKSHPQPMFKLHKSTIAKLLRN